MKNVFSGNPNSVYDPGLIVKEVHDFYGQAIRTIDSRTSVGYYTHFRADYDVNNNPTLVRYYRGTKPYITSVQCLAATALAGTSFLLRTSPDNSVALVYYTVDGIGNAPVYPGAKFLQVLLDSTDSAEIVAAITKAQIDATWEKYFSPITRNGANLSINTNGLGDVDSSLDIDTGFTISGVDGAQELVSEIEIGYSGIDPVYEGQLLKGYSFDIYSGKFQLKSSSSSPSAQAEESTKLDEFSATVNYVGKAPVGSSGSGAVWKIFRLTTTGTVTSIEYANSSESYSNIWDNRTSLTYG